MTDQLEPFSHLNLPKDSAFLEEENFDQLNDLTFGDAVPWDYDQGDIDDIDLVNSDPSHNEFNPLLNQEQPQVSTNLLGLTGSFFNQGLFKFGQKNSDDEFQTTNEFEIAIKKLDLIDDAESNLSKDDEAIIKTIPNDNEMSYDSRYGELLKFSEYLREKFMAIPKINNNLQYLHQIVLTHVESLNNMAKQLKVKPEDLNRLNYFRTLKNFVSINSILASIDAKYGNSIQRQTEIALIFQNFSIQPIQMQQELSMTHPFYANLFMLINAQNQYILQQQMQQRQYQANARYPQQNRKYDEIPEWATEEDKKAMMDCVARQKKFDTNEGGWMSLSEKTWLAKVHTKNLSFDNPYVHDYYFTQKKLKEMTEIRNKEINEFGFSNRPDPITLLPSPITSDQLGAGIDPNKDGLMPAYKPIQFENSLGVVSASNLNTPRQIVQVPPKSELKVRLHNRNRPYIELLGLIEKMYSLILKIDELDKSLARVVVSNHRGSVLLNTHRNYVVKLLLECVNDNSKFSSLFTVEKGAKVILSLFAVVSSTKFIQIMQLFYINCTQIYNSEYFSDIEAQLQTLFITRIKSLEKEDINLLSSVFFTDIKSPKLQKQLSLFFNKEFGLYVILAVLDSYISRCPENKTYIDKILNIIFHSPDSHFNNMTMLYQFTNLFTSSSTALPSNYDNNSQQQQAQPLVG